MFSKRVRRRVGFTALSVAALLLIWQIAAIWVNSPLILPAPLEVFFRLVALAGTPSFLTAVAATLLRALSAFLISLALSLVLGVCIGLSSAADAFLRLPLAVIRATPVVSFILIALFWFTTGTVPVFVSILMALPVLTSAVASGILSTDKKLLEMASVYGLSARQRFRHIYLPSFLPYFFSGAASGIGLSWKVVVASEVLSLPRNSIGYGLQTAKVHLETADVFAWTITVILCSYLMELAFTLTARYARRLYEPN